VGHFARQADGTLETLPSSKLFEVDCDRLHI
jgi:hypothetical protein